MAKAIKKKKRRRSKNRLKSSDYLQPEQVRFILELLKAEAKDGGFRAAVRLFIFQLLLITGLRRGEAAGLELRDLPYWHKKNQIDVRWYIAKSGRERSIVLSAEQAELINSFVKRFRKGCGSRTPLLVNEYGNRMTGYNIYCRMRTIGRKAGILWLHPHAIRHTWGYNWICDRLT